MPFRQRQARDDLLFDLLSGDRHFNDRAAAAPEQIPAKLLSDRLARLLAHASLNRFLTPDGSMHLAYQLTSKGEVLRPPLTVMRDWALGWVPGTQVLVGSG